MDIGIQITTYKMDIDGTYLDTNVYLIMVVIWTLQPNYCLTFLSDNTNYMSGTVGGAVVKFNQISGSSTFGIPCTLHVLHIILTNFHLEKLLQLLDFQKKNIHSIFYILHGNFIMVIMKVIRKVH